MPWRMKSLLFKLIRPFFVKDIDSNEDFNCGWCGEPILRRVIFCSQECEDVGRDAEKLFKDTFEDILA